MSRADSSLAQGQVLDWYEHLDDAALQEVVRSDPKTTLERLTSILGEEEASDIVDDLAGETLEGLFDRKPDPDLPEIIYLHGIMGGHLADQYGAGNRLWLDALALAAGNLAEVLSLQADGVSDADPKYTLGADGHIRVIYAKAARKWRRKRFAVHEIAYDWRKPIHTAADQLHGVIERMAVGNPHRSFALVAHSMGGLVASTYAQRHPGWEGRISGAVFIGSPLGGSYAPIEAVLGEYPFLRAMALVSVPAELKDLQALSTTLPGLIEMMPNPDIFADPVDYYTAAAWPEGPMPSQRWLDESRDAKARILSSPLLERTYGIVSQKHGTVVSVMKDGLGIMRVGPRSGPGDGTVPIKAAAVGQLKGLFEGADERHATLLRDHAVIDGVADILMYEKTDALTPMDLSSADFEATLASVEGPEIAELSTTGVGRRIAERKPTAADLRWLLDPLGGPAPQ